jgi:hypothetical protein
VKTILARAAEFTVLLALLSLPHSSLGQAPPSPLSEEELQVYEHAHTVVDWTPKEIHARKELADLQTPANHGDLTEILPAVGERVLAFINNFPNTTATESIQWQLEGPSPKAAATETFHYMLVRTKTGVWENFQEYRTDAQGNEVDLNKVKGGPLLTSGFSLFLLYFAPDNQDSCRYRYFGWEKLGEQETDVVGFAEIPEESLRLANFNDGPRNIPLLFQGLAWIDARSHEVLRLQIDLLAPPPNTNLRRESTEIEYAPVLLPQTSAPFLLPKRVIVDLWQSGDLVQSRTAAGSSHIPHPANGDGLDNETQGTVHCRNIHTYSNYKLFRVESRIGPTP